MERVIRIFKTHEEAAEADREFYRSLTPEQRLEILFQLNETDSPEWAAPMKRVFRVVKRKPS